MTQPVGWEVCLICGDFATYANWIHDCPGACRCSPDEGITCSGPNYCEGVLDDPDDLRRYGYTDADLPKG